MSPACKLQHACASTYEASFCACAFRSPFPHQLLQSIERGLACGSCSLARPVSRNCQSLRLHPSDTTLNITAHSQYLPHMWQQEYIPSCRHQPASLLVCPPSPCRHYSNRSGNLEQEIMEEPHPLALLVHVRQGWCSLLCI